MMHDFLNFQHHRWNKKNSTQKHIHHRNVHRNARSMSLLDRRGLITAPRFLSRKCSISPLSHHKRQDMDSSDNSAMLMHLLENDGDNPFCAIFLPTMNRSTYHTPMVWQHIQRAAPLHVQPFSQVNNT
ncbi:hypothetical protein ACH3XW_25805 [Acanthocheilonema viteae]